ncbi:MAG: hypothetical protein AAFX53_07455 [Bacteroidota bacterium]
MLNVRIVVLFFCSLVPGLSSAQEFTIDKSYQVDRARQGVALDDIHFYVINNSDIAKYTKNEGTKLQQWQDATGAIKHLNSGIIIDGKLYCANSNYPESPMASSIEVFDPETLAHVENISLGIYIGSATWLDFYDGHWYVAFAHYTGRGSTEGKTNSWTQLVKFTKDWQRSEAWIFPRALIEKFGTRSNSGGFLTKEGIIYATGHDNKELYQLVFPKIGHTLIWKKTHPVPFEGQGIALDINSGDSITLYGIIKKENKVLKTTFKK